MMKIMMIAAAAAANDDDDDDDDYKNHHNITYMLEKVATQNSGSTLPPK